MNGQELKELLDTVYDKASKETAEKILEKARNCNNDSFYIKTKEILSDLGLIPLSR